MTTLQQWQDAQDPPVSDAKLCRLLTEARPSGADSPVYEYRLKRLKAGDARASTLELYLVQAVTGDECDGYR